MITHDLMVAVRSTRRVSLSYVHAYVTVRPGRGYFNDLKTVSLRNGGTPFCVMHYVMQCTMHYVMQQVVLCPF